jgi:hypothetical protein
MKTILPYLSALALMAVAAATIAPLRRAGGQDGGELAVAPFDEFAPADNATAPYRATRNDDLDVEIEAGHLPESKRLILKARHQLERHASIQARFRHQVALEGQQLSGIGTYGQQGAGEELQAYLELQIPAYEASLVQVANGRYLWLDRNLPNGRTVTRINLHVLRAELKAWRGKAAELDDAPASPIDDTSLLFGAQTGGLPGLLASLLDNFDFLPPQAMVLSVGPPESEEPVEVRVFATVGHWKPEKLTMLTGSHDLESQAESLVDKFLAPDRFPLEALLLIRQADLFPYRLEYRRLETPAAGVAGTQPPYHLSADPLGFLQLSDVVFDAPIAPSQFDYAAPSTVASTDQTATLIERLRKQRPLQTAAREAAAR